MKIGIDITSTQDQFKYRGIGKYTKNIVENLLRLDNSNFYYLYKFDKVVSTLEHAFVSFKNIELVNIGNASLSSPKNNNSFLENALKKKMPDVFFSPNIERNVPLGKYKTMVMVHDVIPLSTNSFSQKGRVQNYLKGRWYKKNLNNALRANSIITNSYFSKREIEKYSSRKDIKVIYLGIEDKFFNIKRDKIVSVISKYGIDFEYILYYSGIEKNKNVENLLKSWKFFKDNDKSGVKLILVGKDFSNANKKENIVIQKYIKENNLQNTLFYISFIEDNDLPLLLAGSRCYVSLSLIEGFGFSVLEASAVGIPIIASDIEVYHEVLGDSVTYVNPFNPQEIAQKIEDVIGGKSDFLNTKEIENANRYRWENTAQETLGEILSL